MPESKRDNPRLTSMHAPTSFTHRYICQACGAETPCPEADAFLTSFYGLLGSPQSFQSLTGAAAAAADHVAPLGRQHWGRGFLSLALCRAAAAPDAIARHGRVAVAWACAIACEEQRWLLRASLAARDRHVQRANAEAADAWQALATVLDEEEPDDVIVGEGEGNTRLAREAVLGALARASAAGFGGGLALDEGMDGATDTANKQMLARLRCGLAHQRARDALGDAMLVEHT